LGSRKTTKRYGKKDWKKKPSVKLNKREFHSEDTYKEKIIKMEVNYVILSVWFLTLLTAKEVMFCETLFHFR